MTKISLIWRSFLCALVALTAAPLMAGDMRPVTVFAAASLGDAMQAVLEGWSEPTVLSVAGSGAIARQIDQGAPADVVMLANPVWMDWLETRGRILPGTRSAPIGNALVLVGPPGARPLDGVTKETLLARLGPKGRMAIGEHRSVPAGQYARAWLERHDLWEDIQPYLAEVENVRAALALVARGEVPLAIVYRSDLAASPGSASEVWTIPDHEQPAISYALAAVTERGAALAAYLAGPKARAVFAEFGFTGADE